MKDPEQIAALLFRYVRKELTPEEERELTAWRYQSPENEQLLQEKTDRTRMLAELGRRLEMNEQIHKEIEHYYAADAGRWPAHQRRRRLYITRIAAVFVPILLGLGLYFLLHGTKKTDNRFKATLISPEGISTALDDMQRGFQAGRAGIRFEKDKNGELVYITRSEPGAGRDEYYELHSSLEAYLKLRFPDGTLLWLNKNSKLKYPANFPNDSIHIFIEGEAYFDMPAQSKIPLQITAFPVTVVAAGTRVNLRAYPEERSTTITLLQGTVRVYTDPGAVKPGSAAPLIPGQQVKWENGSFSIPAPVNVEQVIRWKK
jgi:transmembrane sensor